MNKLEKLALARGEETSEAYFNKVLFNLSKVIPNNVNSLHLPDKSALALIEDVCREGDLITVKLNNGISLSTFPSRQQYRNFYYCFRDLLPDYINPENYQAIRDVYARYLKPKARVQQFINDGLAKPDGLTIIECGAYVGWKALAYACFIGDTGKVIAIEMDKKQFDVCDLNIKRNLSADQGKALQTGVWHSVGEQEYRYEHLASHSLATPDEHQFHTQVETVKTDTLDNIIERENLETVDFLNVQTGGSEYESLLGLDKCLDRVKLMWLGTHYKMDGVPVREKCMAYLEKRGWRFYDADRNHGFYAISPNY